jgi:Flp pilus assembly protein TadD
MFRILNARAGIGALALAALPLLAGCNGNSLQSQQALSNIDRPSLKAARGALEQGEAETALSIASGVLSVEPRNVAALVAAGDASATMGNRRSAVSDYNTALKYQPNYVPARLGIAKLKLRDSASDAEAAFRAILVGFPHDAAVLTDLGVALDLQERHTEAQAQYAAALAINPELTSTRVDMGLSLALSGNPDRAEQMLRDATDASAVPAKVRADYAVAEVMAGHADAATETLQADLTPAEARASVAAMGALLPQAAKAAPPAVTPTAALGAAPPATTAMAVTPVK